MNLEKFIEKKANEISMTAEELEHLISQYKKPLMATAGLGLGLFAASPYLSVQAKRKGIEFGDDISNSNTAFSQTMKDHPYLGNIGGTIASSMGSVPFSLANPVLGTAAQMAGISASQAAAGAVIDKNPNSGIGAQFSKEHPYIGSALFGMVPGLHVNQEVAGEELARQALKEKEKSFMYNHPIASSYLSALVPFPGIFGSHSHAAARILNEQERQKNNGIRN